MSKRFTMAERLKSRKLIAEVFKKGVAIKAYPLLAICYRYSDAGPEVCKAGFSVPKKKLKLAVDRNRVKRLIREAYRLNKSEWLNPGSDGWAIMFIWLPSVKHDFEQVEKSMVKILLKLSQQPEVK